MSKSNKANYIILEKYEENGIEYYVSDHINAKDGSTERHLSFKPTNTNIRFLYSAINTNKSTVYQPIYLAPQFILESWEHTVKLSNVLVLGCAGCTIPRFIYKKFSYSFIDGVDISQKMIQIARRYFHIDDLSDRFLLICDDAFAYVARTHSRIYNAIFIDLFNGEVLSDSVFTSKFLSDVYSCMTDFSIAIVNLLNYDSQIIISNIKKIENSFNNTILLSTDNHNTVIMIKNTSNNTISNFIHDISKFGTITNIQ